MNTKSYAKIITFTLAFIMLLSTTLIILSSVSDDTASAQRVTQTQIDNLRAERRELERQRSEVDAKINDLEFDQNTELIKKQILDQRVTVTSLEIENTNATISYLSQLVREKEYEVVLAQAREDEQLDRFRDRVRNMEENGIITYLEIIFDSTSFADMLARIDFVAEIMRADQEAYDDLVAAREETEEAKTGLEDTALELNDEVIRLEEQEIELNEQMEEAAEIIREMENDIDGARELLEQYIADEARITRDINDAIAALERQQEEERLRRLAEQQRQQQNQNNNTNNANNNAPSGGDDTSNNAPSGGGNDTSNNTGTPPSGGGGNSGGGAVVGTGEFTWPVPTHRTVSSPFGQRNGRLHGGIDIPAPTGTSVVAADSGTVLTARWSNSFGNYITISHGNGIVTLYAHLSSMQVSAGDTVSRGQHIGRVGSTGNSTAPHLHFEIRVNGVRIDPQTRL